MMAKNYRRFYVEEFSHCKFFNVRLILKKLMGFLASRQNFLAMVAKDS